MSTRQHDHHDGGGAAVEPTATHDLRHSCLNPRLLLLVCVMQCYLILCLLVYINPTLTTRTVNGIEPLTSSIPLTVRQPGETEKIRAPRLRDDSNHTAILVWRWPYGQYSGPIDCRDVLNIDGCSITTDRSMYHKAHGVVFHHKDTVLNLGDMPALQRPFFQKWVWMNFESPTNSPKSPEIENIFNLTCTYRADSDIPVPYGFLVPRIPDTEMFQPPPKDKLICWVISNYNPDHARSKYYQELSSHIDIHVYGNAAGYHIPNDQFMPLLASCKFYLAFENSIHTDYITEKLYKPLLAGSVPIVLGAARQNYEKYVPSTAFIHIHDYNSVSDLVAHIRTLDKNRTLYLNYFQWRRHYTVHPTKFWQTPVCHICAHIKTHTGRKITNIHDWFWV
nr:alpha-(1,3)fucosyltransferase [Elephant endotheliotropic herpesvirus 1A]